MLAGHFGLAAIVKSRQPQAPLWALMLSTQLLDVLFVALYAFGIESFTAAPGTNGGYGNMIIHADYTHSLVGALAISLLAMLVAWIFWGRLNGFVIGAVVFSHWILDLLVHRNDMAILPGNANNMPRLGLSLWSIPWLSAAVELGIILGGAYLYYHAAMRTAIRADRRQKEKDSTAPAGNHRQYALISSVVMAVLLVGTLAADVLFG